MAEDKKIKVCKILHESFAENKSIDYILKGGNNKDKQREHLIEYAYDHCNKFGSIYLNQNACALVLYPKKIKKNLADYFRDFMLIFNAVGLANIPRLLDKEAVIKAKQLKQSDGIYLWFIGVKKNAQQAGIGTALLQQIIADYPGKSIILETSAAENISFYKKNGFEEYDQHQFSFKLYFLKKD